MQNLKHKVVLDIIEFLLNIFEGISWHLTGINCHNQSLCTGIFPSKLKIGKLLPLFRKGDQFSFENYRPISLRTSISKIFEKVFDQLYDYFARNKLFYNSQYGFRKEHSTYFAALGS